MAWRWVPSARAGTLRAVSIPPDGRDDREHEGRLAASITLRLGRCSGPSPFDSAGQPGPWPVWRKIAPDPDPILRLAPESYRPDPTPPGVLLARRARLLGPSLSVSDRRKLEIVRGRGAYLYDHTGRAFLDGVNNVCHVGHAHPHVV